MFRTFEVGWTGKKLTFIKMNRKTVYKGGNMRGVTSKVEIWPSMIFSRIRPEEDAGEIISQSKIYVDVVGKSLDLDKPKRTTLDIESLNMIAKEFARGA